MKDTAQMLVFLALWSSLLYGCREKQEAPVASWPDYKKAQAFLAQKGDSAFYYFNKIATTAKDSLTIATAYNYMAIIQSDAGDYFGSQESLLTSLLYLDEKKEKDYVCIASDYNELGISNVSLKNYDAAINYYKLAIKFARDENYKQVYLNNLAYCYKEKGDYVNALADYGLIINQNNGDKTNYARVIASTAATRWLSDTAYNPVPEFSRALQIQQTENDSWGQNLTYGYLSDYYFTTQADSALRYAKNLYTVAQALKSPDDEIAALQKLIALSWTKDAKSYFVRYKNLNDSIQTARNNAKNQFALIRYEAAKNKADNLQLQNENEQKKWQIRWQWGLLLVIGLLVAWLILWYRKSRQQIKWNAEKTIRDNQLKISQKVHDVVANGLYRIMTELEHKPIIDKPKLTDAIESLYERSRDISYEPLQKAEGDYSAAITQLLSSFATDHTKVMIVGNEPGVWRGVSERVQNELQHVLQELMVNMKKHSAAKNVVLKFQRADQQLKIQYVDDGIGLPTAFAQGNGLTSTGNRIKTLGGQINFDSQENKGLSLRFNFPIIPA